MSLDHLILVEVEGLEVVFQHGGFYGIPLGIIVPVSGDAGDCLEVSFECAVVYYFLVCIIILGHITSVAGVECFE